jgi:hypothetical protein
MFLLPRFSLVRRPWGAVGLRAGALAADGLRFAHAPPVAGGGALQRG